ncbi:MAG: hypothetical protein JO307_02435 [Bryobacterales bacterium]|nr:hypothetical protein [Bryobacterales bacterium]MBV9398567.1 hypothetical protein [Bryobacterales bacterium]
MPQKFTIPKFESEAEEAQWWYDNRWELAQAFEDAAAHGRLRIGSAARLARERAGLTDSATTISLDPEDVKRAREFAAKRGLRYNAYLRMLLHEALASEEKTLAR